MKGTSILTVISAMFVLSVLGVEEDKCSTFFEGCKISKGECLCGEVKGCKNTYPYKDMEECQRELKGTADHCKPNPCEHGDCAQIKADGVRTFRCECAGTDYYGSRCQHSCNDVSIDPDVFVAECVTI